MVQINLTEKISCLEDPLQDHIPDNALDKYPAIKVMQLHAIGDLVCLSVVFEPTERVWVKVIGVDPKCLLLPGSRINPM